jgi:uncharacterized protein (DUF302 family)
MSYYFAKTIDRSFEQTVADVRAALAAEGFGVLTEIDVQKTLKAKIGEDFRPYVILGACNPGMAFKALQMEDKVGAMLPCNVVVQELATGRCEVAAIDPVASMQAIDNPALKDVAGQVAANLRAVVESL